MMGFLLRWKNAILVVIAVIVINVPEVSVLHQAHARSVSGVDLRASVVAHHHLGNEFFLTFKIAKDVPEQGDKAFTGTARVDQHSYDVSTRSGLVDVRIVPGSTTNWSMTGEVKSSLGLVVTLLADLFLVLIVILMVRFRPKLRPELVLLAEEDLERCPPGSVLDRLEGMRYLVCGEVHTIEADAVVLELGDRRVRVLLDGHHNPAGYQQPVRATGTMIA